MIGSTIFVTYFLLSIFSLYPTAAHRASRGSRIPDTESLHASRPWEMTDAPRTPGTSGGLKSPATPRTMAFNTLSKNGKAPKKGKAPVKQGNGSVPLRHHISMGDETYSGPSDGRWSVRLLGLTNPGCSFWSGSAGWGCAFLVVGYFLFV